MQQGYTPQDPSEWFPFIEGYARTHRYQTAAELSEKILDNVSGRDHTAVIPLAATEARGHRELRGVECCFAHPWGQACA